MTAKEIFDSAINQLGYTENATMQRRAVSIINKIYFEMFIIFKKQDEEFSPIKSLGENIKLPVDVVSIVMPLGVAAGIALGEGDGELQQYFAYEYDRARKRYGHFDTIKDVMA